MSSVRLLDLGVVGLASGLGFGKAGVCSTYYVTDCAQLKLVGQGGDVGGLQAGCTMHGGPAARWGHRRRTHALAPWHSYGDLEKRFQWQKIIFFLWFLE